MQDSNRLQVFYRMALLLPLLGLTFAAAVKWSVTPSEPPLPYGGRSIWIYPPSLIRGLLAYGLVIVWLYCHLGRRRLREYETLLWQAPLTYMACECDAAGRASFISRPGRNIPARTPWMDGLERILRGRCSPLFDSRQSTHLIGGTKDSPTREWIRI
jgi:hypothetical protein